MNRRRNSLGRGRLPRDDAGAGSTFRPQLTSLVDVMTILLVFLLKSFSVEGQIITPSHDLELPVSSSTQPPKPMATIEITRRAVSSEGTVIALVESFAYQDSLLVEPLFKWIQLLRKQVGNSGSSQEILIQCDKSIPFNIVKRVMYTCSRGGVTDFSVLVLEQQ